MSDWLLGLIILYSLGFTLLLIFAIAVVVGAFNEDYYRSTPGTRNELRMAARMLLLVPVWPLALIVWGVYSAVVGIVFTFTPMEEE